MSRLAKISALALAFCLCASGMQVNAADDQSAAQSAAAKAGGKDGAHGTDRVFEMRTYYPAPGKLDALHARFRNHTNRLLEKHGATLIGYWVTLPEKGKEGSEQESQGRLVWIVAYPSLEAREKTWKAFGADPEWVKAKTESEKDGRLVAKAESVFMNPTDYSPMK